MAYGEYIELTRYIVVTRDDKRWTYGRGYNNPCTPKVKILSKLPAKRAWNDYYFPVTIKVPSFYEEEVPLEFETPPVKEGDAIVEALQAED